MFEQSIDQVGHSSREYQTPANYGMSALAKAMADRNVAEAQQANCSDSIAHFDNYTE